MDQDSESRNGILEQLEELLNTAQQDIQTSLERLRLRKSVDRMAVACSSQARRKVMSASPLESTNDEAIAPVFTSIISDRTESLKEFSIDCDEVIIEGDEEIRKGDANIVEEQGLLSMVAKEISISPKGIQMSGNLNTNEGILSHCQVISIVSNHLPCISIVSNQFESLHSSSKSNETRYTQPQRVLVLETNTSLVMRLFKWSKHECWPPPQGLVCNEMAHRAQQFSYLVRIPLSAKDAIIYRCGEIVWIVFKDKLYSPTDDVLYLDELLATVLCSQTSVYYGSLTNSYTRITISYSNSIANSGVTVSFMKINSVSSVRMLKQWKIGLSPPEDAQESTRLKDQSFVMDDYRDTDLCLGASNPQLEFETVIGHFQYWVSKRVGFLTIEVNKTLVVSSTFLWIIARGMTYQGSGGCTEILDTCSLPRVISCLTSSFDLADKTEVSLYWGNRTADIYGIFMARDLTFWIAQISACTSSSFYEMHAPLYFKLVNSPATILFMIVWFLYNKLLLAAFVKWGTSISHYHVGIIIGMLSRALYNVQVFKAIQEGKYPLQQEGDGGLLGNLYNHLSKGVYSALLGSLHRAVVVLLPDWPPRIHHHWLCPQLNYIYQTVLMAHYGLANFTTIWSTQLCQRKPSSACQGVYICVLDVHSSELFAQVSVLQEMEPCVCDPGICSCVSSMHLQFDTVRVLSLSVHAAVQCHVVTVPPCVLVLSLLSSPHSSKIPAGYVIHKVSISNMRWFNMLHSVVGSPYIYLGKVMFAATSLKLSDQHLNSVEVFQGKQLNVGPIFHSLCLHSKLSAAVLVDRMLWNTQRGNSFNALQTILILTKVGSYQNWFWTYPTNQVWNVIYRGWAAAVTYLSSLGIVLFDPGIGSSVPCSGKGCHTTFFFVLFLAMDKYNRLVKSDAEPDPCWLQRPPSSARLLCSSDTTVKMPYSLLKFKREVSGACHNVIVTIINSSMQLVTVVPICSVYLTFQYLREDGSWLYKMVLIYLIVFLTMVNLRRRELSHLMVGSSLRYTKNIANKNLLGEGCVIETLSGKQSTIRLEAPGYQRVPDDQWDEQSDTCFTCYDPCTASGQLTSVFPWICGAQPRSIVICETVLQYIFPAAIREPLLLFTRVTVSLNVTLLWWIAWSVCSLFVSYCMDLPCYGTRHHAIYPMITTISKYEWSTWLQFQVIEGQRGNIQGIVDQQSE